MKNNDKVVRRPFHSYHLKFLLLMVNSSQCIIIIVLFNLNYSYTEPCKAPYWEQNRVYHEEHKQLVYSFIRDRYFVQHRTIEDSTKIYLSRSQKWKSIVEEHEYQVQKQLNQDSKRTRRTLRSSMCIMGRTNDSFSSSPLVTRRKTKNCPSGASTPSVDGNTSTSIANNFTLSAGNPNEKKIRKGFAVCPRQYTDETEKYYSSFKENNNSRLTTDRDIMKCQDFDHDTPCPVNCNCPKAIQIQEDLINPWTDLEKLIFLLVFFAHPKDFSMIARCLRNKTYQDVVSYYYKSKKVVQYKELLKRLISFRRKSQYDLNYVAIVACKNLGLKIPDSFFSPGLRVEEIMKYLGELSYDSYNALKTEEFVDTLNRVTSNINDVYIIIYI